MQSLVFSPDVKMFLQFLPPQDSESGGEGGKNLDDLERELRERAVKSMKKSKGKVVLKTFSFFFSSF